MRFISTKVHGVMDYISGLLLIVSPWLFYFADGTAAQSVPVIIGITLLLVSILTKYEVGVANVMSMPMHLSIDIIAGIILIASPWLYNFADRIMWPHVVFGVFEIMVGFMTQTLPQSKRILA